MPARSLKQLKLMAAAANNPSVAKKIGISQDKAAEFVHKKPKGKFSKLRKAMKKQ